MKKYWHERTSFTYKYKYNSYFYRAPVLWESLTDGALQKSANTCFTAVGRLYAAFMHCMQQIIEIA